MMAKRRKAGWWIVPVAVAVIIGVAAYSFSQRNEPEVHANILEHFKYGSIGSEGRAGVPYSLWLALPRAFPEHLPKGPGNGFERLGFLYEPGQRRPIGTSYREEPVGEVGLNCAVCHTATVRESPEAPRRIVFGMPANQFHLQAYVNFLRKAGKDERFNAETLIPIIREVDPDFSRVDELLYRHYVIPRTRKALREEVDDDFAWMDRRPAQGPGRVDTFNPYKVLLGIERPSDADVGTVDLPSLWNQRPRRGMYLHWDGNNNSVEERNISAAIGAGVEENTEKQKDTLDEPSMARIAEWINDFKPQPYPADRIDPTRARRGAEVFREQCAACHDFKGERVGQVTPIEQIGTDRERLDSFTPTLARGMNTLGTGRPWRFTHFRKTNGYANMPLDGLWLRAPYLHNGSVPNLRALLFPAERPEVFYRNYDVYDWERVGFVSDGDEARRVGFRFDTTVRGNGNGGHTYGARLPSAEKDDLLEYLKGL